MLFRDQQGLTQGGADLADLCRVGLTATGGQML